MIDGDEPDLVEEGDLAQLLDDADLVAAVVGECEGPAWDPDVLVVVDGEVLAVARARPPNGATPSTSVMNSNSSPFQV